MQRAERRRQKAIDAGHEWQSRYCRQICAGRADVAERDEECRERNHPFEADALRGLRYRLHQSLQVADFRRRQRHQHADRAHDVTQCHRDSGDHRARGMARRAFLISPPMIEAVSHPAKAKISTDQKIMSLR